MHHHSLGRGRRPAARRRGRRCRPWTCSRPAAVTQSHPRIRLETLFSYAELNYGAIPAQISYRTDHGVFPSKDAGWNALFDESVGKTTEGLWKGPYMSQRYFSVGTPTKVNRSEERRVG